MRVTKLNLLSKTYSLTQFSNLEDLAQHSSEFDGTPAEGTFVLVLTAAVLQDNLYEREDCTCDGLFHLPEMSKVMPEAKTNPDIRVLVNLGQVQHVVQSQHPRRSLGEIHGRVHMILHLKQKGHESSQTIFFKNELF